MATKITFTLSVKDEKFDDIISNIRCIDELHLQEDRDKKGDIICSATLPNDNAERTANLCGSMFNMDGVKSTKLFVTSVDDKKIKSNRLLPYIPMILSSTITFLIIFNVLGTLGKDSDLLEVFKLAGIPTIVVFLSQLMYAIQESLIQGLKKISSI